MQDPNQGYPRFDQPQAGVQPGFAVQHNNPYGQPAPGQAYIPPTQYGAQPFPAVPQQDNLVTEMEVRQIDQHLSSGCYACYNCWLYVVAIFGILGGLGGLASMFQWIPFIFQALEGFCAAFYAFTMLDALKNKKVEKAELGVKLSLVSAVLMAGVYFANYSFAGHISGSYSAATPILYGIVPGYILMFFIYINPAMKIKGHLERREAVLQKGSNPYNV